MQAVTDGDAALLAAWTIRAGRQLRLGPDWQESSDRLAFDDCSGDYWVLDALGQRIVSRLLRRQSGASPAPLGVNDAPGVPAPSGHELQAALAQLLEAGVIQPVAPPAPE